MTTIDTWEQCYAQGWPAALLVPQAYEHPAKYSRALIQKIYEHILAEGWIEKGQLIEVTPEIQRHIQGELDNLDFMDVL